MRRYLAKFIFALQFRRFRHSARPHFRGWIELEELKERVIRAAEEGGGFAESIYALLSAALGVSPKWLQLIDWVDLLLAFNQVCLHNLPGLSLPLLNGSGPQKSKRDPWDYDGRMWYLYTNLIARAYGWSLEQISQLQVEDALAILQEILTDEQLDREFRWGMSTVAYSEDRTSKTMKFNELPRPYWMRPPIQPVKKFKIAARLLPVGMVDYGAVDEATRPKEIGPEGNVPAVPSGVSGAEERPHDA